MIKHSSRAPAPKSDPPKLKERLREVEEKLEVALAEHRDALEGNVQVTQEAEEVVKVLESIRPEGQ